MALSSTVCDLRANFYSVSPREDRLEGWVDLPLWVAPGLGYTGLMNANVDRALADGLTLRPLHETIADTRAWAATRSPGGTREAGITRERSGPRGIRGAHP